MLWLYKVESPPFDSQGGSFSRFGFLSLSYPTNNPRSPEGGMESIHSRPMQLIFHFKRCHFLGEGLSLLLIKTEKKENGENLFYVTMYDLGPSLDPVACIWYIASYSLLQFFSVLGKGCVGKRANIRWCFVCVPLSHPVSKPANWGRGLGFQYFPLCLPSPVSREKEIYFTRALRVRTSTNRILENLVVDDFPKFIKT